jgi:phosphomannomutase
LAAFSAQGARATARHRVGALLWRGLVKTRFPVAGRRDMLACGRRHERTKSQDAQRACLFMVAAVVVLLYALFVEKECLVRQRTSNEWKILRDPMTPRDPIKVYDARWENEEFNDDEVRRLFEATFAYGRLLGVDTVTLTRDARFGCPRILELGVETAVRSGLRTFVRYEPISTPQGYFTSLWVSQQYPKTMGLGITASHNPKQYIGIKFTVPTVHAIGLDCGPLGGLTKVRELYHGAGKFPQNPGGSLTLLDLTREYIDFSLHAAGAKAGELSGLTVVLDAFHGSAGPEIYQALTRAGGGIVSHRLTPNGEFPTGSPNPTSQGKMKAACALATQHKAAAVLGIDGDGDRIVFGDGRGILTAGISFIPILKACGIDSRAPARVLYDPKVSPLALAEWGRLGCQPLLFRNGHSQIKDYMTQVGALAAAEESGHYYHRIALGRDTVSGENSILTILLFLRALKQQPELMDQLWRIERRLFTSGEFNYQFDSDETRDRALACVVAHFVQDGAAAVTATPDGIDLQGTCLSKGVQLEPGSVALAAGWYSGYLRIATNEKAVVRSYFSAGDIPFGKQLEARAREILEQKFKGRPID